MTNRGSQKPHVVAGVDNVASLMEQGREGAALSSLERVKRVFARERPMILLWHLCVGAALALPRRSGWGGSVKDELGKPKPQVPSGAKCHRPPLTQKALSSLDGKFPLCYC